LKATIEKYIKAMNLVNECDKELKETKEKIKIVNENKTYKILSNSKKMDIHTIN
jgi:exonuclease VII small subunit